MIQFIHKKLKEFFEDFYMSDDAVGVWLFFSWMVIGFISWFIFAKFGYYLLFVFLHLWLFPLIIGSIASRLAMETTEEGKRWWFVLGSLACGVIFCLLFIKTPSRIGLYSQIFIHERQAGHSLRGIHLFKEYINFFNFFELNWRSDVFSDVVFFQVILWIGLGVAPAVYSFFGIWEAKEELKMKMVQAEKEKKIQIEAMRKKEEEDLRGKKYQRWLDAEAEKEQIAQEKERVEKATQKKRKEDLESGDIFESGFLD